MKLRLKGDSLRLRVTQSEVKKIREGITVEETVNFGGGTPLKYQLLASREHDSISSTFAGSVVTVAIPWKVSEAWASSSAVSLSAKQESGLELLIEKDFTCLKPRSQAEDESDLFPNPNEAHGRCGSV